MNKKDLEVKNTDSDYKEIFDQTVDKLNEDHSFESTRIKRTIPNKKRSLLSSRLILVWTVLMALNVILLITLQLDVFDSGLEMDRANTELLTTVREEPTTHEFAKFISSISTADTPQDFMFFYNHLFSSINADQFSALDLPNPTDIKKSGSSISWNSSSK